MLSFGMVTDAGADLDGAVAAGVRTKRRIDRDLT
jgi:hypothetical protein